MQRAKFSLQQAAPITQPVLLLLESFAYSILFRRRRYFDDLLPMIAERYSQYAFSSDMPLF